MEYVRTRINSKVEYSTSSKKGRLVLLATILASGMVFIMGTAISIALPTIQKALGADISGIQWIVNAHTLVLASLLLLGGSLGDHFGRKRIFVYGIGIFVIGAILSGLANSVGMLISFQVIQGLGSAMLIPGSLAIINSCFAESHRGKAIGLWSGFSAGLAAFGPFMGGFLVETFGWPSIFFVNAPLGLIAILVALKFVPESKNPDARRLDWPGIFSIVLGLLGLSFGLIRGPLSGWSDPLVIFSLLGGAMSLILFIIIEARSREPMVPFGIFKNPLVTGANIVTLFLYLALNGVIFFLVLNFQQVQNYSPTFAGLALLPPILLITFLSGPAGSLGDKIGPRRQMIAGPLIVGE